MKNDIDQAIQTMVESIFADGFREGWNMNPTNPNNLLASTGRGQIQEDMIKNRQNYLIQLCDWKIKDKVKEITDSTQQLTK